MGKLLTNLRNYFLAAKSKIGQTYKGMATQLQKRPMASFLTALAVLLLAIIISKILFTPKTQPEKKITQIKEVTVYRVGSTPKLTFQGQIKKSGVVKILSQTAGVVQNINVTEGQKVAKGANLLNLSTNYQGADVGAVQAAIAARQYQQATDTFDTQTDLINKQRDLGNKLHDNTSSLATISAQSHDETQSLINLNNNILNTLNATLTNLENTNVGGANDQAILQIKVQIAQLQAGQNQLQGALRNLDFSTGSNNPPLQMADLQRDITQKQLDLQQKGLEMNRDLSKLQLALAGITASLSHPSAPLAGVIARVFVRPLEVVNPATPLLTIVGDSKELQITALLPQAEAVKLSRLEPATVHFRNGMDTLPPNYITSEATDNQLYAVTFNLPEKDYDQVADGDFIPVDLPLAVGSTPGTYFVPLDAVAQTQEQSLVYIIDHDRVASRTVTLGPVSGQFVQVTSGLNGNEQVILNRNVLVGDSVKAI